jgi:hypothetical protein
MRLSLVALVWTALLGISFIIAADPAIAAEQIVLRYGQLERSISVADLSRFAETGELSRPLRRYFRLAQQEPYGVRRVLNYPAPVNTRTLDRVLNSPLGNLVLAQLTQAVYTSSRAEDETALRSALVAASQDNQLSLIEVIQNYPTPQVYVDGERLVAAYQQLSILSDRLEPLLDQIRTDS